MLNKRQRLHGVWAAMPTPWNADFTIDVGLVRDLVARYADAGFQGAYTTGTDGEMHVLDVRDFRVLVRAVGDSAAAANVRFQIGCTWAHSDGVIERARIARDSGIQRIQVALPSWVPLSDDEILRYFEALQEALSDMEFVHYNIARAGRFLTGGDYRAILQVAPNLIGSKHTGGDVASLIEIAHLTPQLDHFVVDSQIVPGALFGASGFYSFLANLCPQIANALWRLCEDGRWEDAARLRTRIDLFFNRWLSTIPEITASPALGKIATRAGILPSMSLAVRPPYRSGAEEHVQTLHQLIYDLFPDFVATR